MDTTFGKPMLTLSFREILSYVDTWIAQAPLELQEQELIPWRNLGLLPAIDAVTVHEQHAGLVYVVDLFRQAFHDLIMPMEPWLFIKMPDFNNDLERYDISREDAFQILPGFFDCQRILGKDKWYSVHDYFRSPVQGRIAIDEIVAIMNQCGSSEAEEGAIQLGLLEQRNRVVSLWNQVQVYVQKHSMKEVFDAIWESYEQVTAIVFQVQFRGFPEVRFTRSPRYIEMKEVLVPILQLREYQEKMEAFSANDLDSREILAYADQTFSGETPVGDILPLMLRKGQEVQQQYAIHLKAFSVSPLFDQFCTAEKKWYQQVELLYLTLSLTPGVVDIDEMDDLIMEYRESEHADALYELRELVFGEDASGMLGQDRGEVIDVETWEKIRTGFSRHESGPYLETVDAATLFHNACLADDESTEIAAVISSPQLLKELRISRANLTERITLYTNMKRLLAEFAERDS